MNGGLFKKQTLKAPETSGMRPSFASTEPTRPKVCDAMAIGSVINPRLEFVMKMNE